MKNKSTYVDELSDTGGDSRNIKSVVSDVDPQKKRKMDLALAIANKVNEAAWGRDKMANLQAAHDRHSEKAIAANRAGDHEAVKVHQSKMGMIKTQMNKLRMRKEEVELEEAIKLNSKVTIHAPGKSYHGKTGQVGEIRNGAFKGAPKTYTVDHDGGSVQLDKKNIKLHKEETSKDPREYDYEGDMAKSQLRSIIANAQQAHDMLKDNTNMAEWVQSKITLAADYISTVADYMQSEVKEEVEQVDELKTSTLMRYNTKAHASAHKLTGQASQAMDNDDRETASKLLNKRDNREVGIDRSRAKIQQNVANKLKKEEFEIHEAWTQGNRNPQRGVKVGDKVRSYDFPGMHDDHYIEGHVVADNAHTYHIRVNKVVRGGKELPVPAHMQHVEAPKGKGMFNNAYAVHKMMAKQQSVTPAPEAAKGAEKTFNAARNRLREAAGYWGQKKPSDLEKIKKALEKEKRQAGKLKVSKSPSRVKADLKYYDHMAKEKA